MYVHIPCAPSYMHSLHTCTYIRILSLTHSTHTQTHTHFCTCYQISMDQPAAVSPSQRAHINTYGDTHATHARTSMHVDIHILHTHTYTLACTHSYGCYHARTYAHECIYAWTRTCMHTYMYLYMFMHTCIYTHHTHAHAHTWAHARTHTAHTT